MLDTESMFLLCPSLLLFRESSGILEVVCGALCYFSQLFNHAVLLHVPATTELARSSPRCRETPHYLMLSLVIRMSPHATWSVTWNVLTRLSNFFLLLFALPSILNNRRSKFVANMWRQLGPNTKFGTEPIW